MLLDSESAVLSLTVARDRRDMGGGGGVLFDSESAVLSLTVARDRRDILDAGLVTVYLETTRTVFVGIRETGGGSL